MSMLILAAALQATAVPGVALPPPIVPSSSAVATDQGEDMGAPSSGFRAGNRVSPNPSPRTQPRYSIDPRDAIRSTENRFDRR